MSQPVSTSTAGEQNLERGLGLKESIAIVIGTVIGTGVFLKSGIMAQTLGSAWIVLAAWIVGGLLSFAGALTYSELGSLFPKSGGEFVYLEKAYGKLPAFLYGWMRFWIGAPGSVAAYAVGAATFLGALFHGFSDTTRIAVAILFIAIFTALNCMKVKSGGTVQVILTVLKVLMISAVVFGVFFFGHGSFTNFSTSVGASGWRGWSVFGTAVIAALWAYDGWNNIPMASGEIRDAQKNVPKALIYGMGAILLIYGLVNLSYFFSMPMSEAITAFSSKNPTGLPIATLAAAKFMGGGALAFLSIAFVVSALGAMHGSILTNGRVPYAMAHEGVFFSVFGKLSAKTKIPLMSILAQSAIACLLAASGTFDQLTDYVIFWSYIFYFLCAFSVFIFRRRLPDAPRAYRVPGYPVVPIIFMTLTGVLLINALITSPREALIGLFVLATGLPFYLSKLRTRAR